MRSRNLRFEKAIDRLPVVERILAPLACVLPLGDDLGLYHHQHEDSVLVLVDIPGDEDLVDFFARRSSKLSYSLRHSHAANCLEFCGSVLRDENPWQKHWPFELVSVLDQIEMEMNVERVKENVLLVLIQHPTPSQEQFSASFVDKFLHN